MKTTDAKATSVVNYLIDYINKAKKKSKNDKLSETKIVKRYESKFPFLRMKQDEKNKNSNRKFGNNDIALQSPKNELFSKIKNSMNCKNKIDYSNSNNKDFELNTSTNPIIIPEKEIEMNKSDLFSSCNNEKLFPGKIQKQFITSKFLEKN